ncbi:hypothetical protein GCM10010252_24270 [Streptomyces aureoverticillatus]|nr:hypothetical protein GCM10010252_24270 [Streptomyces aureoverticillatus]
MADIAGLADLARDRLGRIDHVFVNHGIAEFAELAEVTEESWDRQFAINTKGSFFTMQRLAPLINDGGSVVFTTVVNDVVFPGLSAYSASKEAMRAFAHVLAVELLPRGIRVNWGATGPSTRSPRPRCSSPPTRRSRRTSSWRWTAGSRRGCPSATDGSPVRGRSGAP